ncbi:hypothetical protein MUK42_33701 [Musa troglodytarum]|uniref:Uncharacterized protein n=1 Tax=Musa troglodytarum TaxID=320322 RepID=A0A9E7FFI1_9LILI|nr:hypothetical protein MUK42_33701 [Musa troglodytarum]
MNNRFFNPIWITSLLEILRRWFKDFYKRLCVAAIFGIQISKAEVIMKQDHRSYWSRTELLPCKCRTEADEQSSWAPAADSSCMMLPAANAIDLLQQSEYPFVAE